MPMPVVRAPIGVPLLALHLPLNLRLVSLRPAWMLPDPMAGMQVLSEEHHNGNKNCKPRHGLFLV
jgi:hypothetical protein